MTPGERGRSGRRPGPADPSTVRRKRPRRRPAADGGSGAVALRKVLKRCPQSSDGSATIPRSPDQTCSVHGRQWLKPERPGRVAATAYFGPGAGPSPNKGGRLRNPAQVLVRLCDRGRRSGLGEQRSSLTCSADCATSEATSTAAGDREGVDSPLQPTSSTVTASNDSGWLPPAGRRAPSSRRGPRSPTNPAGRPGTLRPAALIDPTRAAGGTCHLVGTQVTRWPLARRARQGGARLLRRLQREGTVTPLAAAEQSRSPALDFAGIRITPRRGHGVRGSGGG